MSDALRLIEDYLPIEAISAEASREKSVRKGHISTLHLWWARRPLVACRAAVYGALVPADRWVKEVELKDPPEDAEKAARAKNGKKKGLNRKAAKEFVTKLCRYPKTNPTKPADIKLKRETEAAIVEAQRHILEAHAERLTAELAEAKKTGNVPAWVEEFKWPFSFNREPTGSASRDGTASPNALPVGVAVKRRRERVETLWEMGIAGADLVIACVGAGLRAFTKYEKVEYANGEEVPAETFLAEVEGVVLDTMMEKLLAPEKTPLAPPLERGGRIAVSAIDPASRFYVLWRFVYKAAEIDAGEAIVFTYAQHVELDGPLGLSTGKDALVEKKKAKYRARDFTERGDNDKLGLPEESQAGKPVPLIDVLHRVLWLMESSPRKRGGFLNEAGPDRERLRVLAQSLVGASLSGKSEEDAEKLIGTTAAEKAALGKLLANWRSLIDHAVETPAARADKKRGQSRMFE